MTAIDNGGPAFPQGIDQGASQAGFPIIEITGGMSMRAYIATEQLKSIIIVTGHPEGETISQQCGMAILYADELISQLKEGEK